jgi:hypothetical protein
MVCCRHCLEEMADLRSRVEALEARLLPAVLSAVDAALLASLWPIVAAEWGTAPWTVSELRQRPNVRLVLGSRSPASLGQLFAKAAGRSVVGFELEKLARQGSRTLWVLWRRSSGSPQV